MNIYAEKSHPPLVVLLGIWSVSALTALPGLAIAPIMGDLQSIFPNASEMEIQMLTSLPSLMILPFILLSGYLTQKVDIYKLLKWGLIIFGSTGILYLISGQMWQLVWVSALLGVGAGIIIPLSTGLISVYFTGKARTRQFGLNSSISNLTVVVATFLTGYLAGANWKLPFIVYLLPFAALFFTFPLKKYRPDSIPEADSTAQPACDDRSCNESWKIEIGKYGVDIKHLWHVMALYGILTFSVAIYIFYLPFFIKDHTMPGELSGSILSVFFLAIMFPGLFLNKITELLGRQTILVAILLVAIGLLVTSLTDNGWVMSAAAVVSGIGYGIVQPLCYDKAIPVSIPGKRTIALACIMFMNYIAILMCPFIIDGLKSLVEIQGNIFPFRLGVSVVLVLYLSALLRNKRFVFSIPG